VLEAADRPGGKAGTATVDGVTFDTGPSLLTLPHVLDEVLREAGTSLADELDLLRLDPCFRYHWPDGAMLETRPEMDGTLAAVRDTFGGAAEEQLAEFLRYAERIWTAAGPRFVLAGAPSLTSLLSWSGMRDVRAIDPLGTMAGGITRRVTEPHLRALLLRFATYVGSDPRRAPAALNCIAHVELGLGGYGVRGGIGALVDAFVRVAERRGVEIRCAERVERIDVTDGRVRGVLTARARVSADVVVANGEPTHTLGVLCGASPAVAPPTSSSGFTCVVRASRAPRAAHTVWFTDDPEAELDDLFVAGRPPREPTIYACAPEVAHGVAGWSAHEPLFVMTGAPCEPPEGSDRATWATVEHQVRSALVRHGAIEPTDEIVWRRTPRELAARFPGSRGALYGAASHGARAAFRRPRNRVDGIAGLYLASGGAHPGGGLPLCVASGRAAANAACADVGMLP
jgi:phytoene desaturase